MTAQAPQIHEYLTLTARISPLSRFLLERGRAADNAPLQEQEQALLTAVDWEVFKPRRCYYNALMLMLDLGEPPGLIYFEGLAQSYILPTNHAWLELNGKVIDPTWGRRECPPQHPILGVYPAHWEYWGVPIPFETVRRAAVGHCAAISILDDWECRWPFILGGQCVGDKES